jgi:hypothetical protein
MLKYGRINADGIVENIIIAEPEFISSLPDETTKAWLAVDDAVAIGSLHTEERGFIPPSKIETTKQLIALDTDTRDQIAEGFEFAGEKFSYSIPAQLNWIALGVALLGKMIKYPRLVTTIDDKEHELKTPEDVMSFLNAAFDTKDAIIRANAKTKAEIVGSQTTPDRRSP